MIIAVKLNTASLKKPNVLIIEIKITIGRKIPKPLGVIEILAYFFQARI